MQGAMSGIFKESKAIIRRSVEERGLPQTLKYVATRGPLYLKRIVGELLDALSLKGRA